MFAGPRLLDEAVSDLVYLSDDSYAPKIRCDVTIVPAKLTQQLSMVSRRQGRESAS